MTSFYLFSFWPTNNIKFFFLLTICHISSCQVLVEIFVSIDSLFIVLVSLNNVTHKKNSTAIFTIIKLANIYWFLSWFITDITFLPTTNNLLHQEDFLISELAVVFYKRRQYKTPFIYPLPFSHVKGKWNVRIFFLKKMLTSALRILVKNLVKESFYWKRKKKLMFWQLFSFHIKVISKLS